MKAKLAYKFLSLLSDFKRENCYLYGDHEGGVAIYHIDPVTFDETILLDDEDKGLDLRQCLVNAFGKDTGEVISDKWDEYLRSEEKKTRFVIRFKTSLAGLYDQECTKTVWAENYADAHAKAVEMKATDFNPDYSVSVVSVEEVKEGNGGPV